LTFGGKIIISLVVSEMRVDNLDNIALLAADDTWYPSPVPKSYLTKAYSGTTESLGKRYMFTAGDNVIVESEIEKAANDGQ